METGRSKRFNELMRRRQQAADQQRLRLAFSRSDRRRLTLAQAKRNLKDRGIPRRDGRALRNEWHHLMAQFPKGTI